MSSGTASRTSRTAAVSVLKIPRQRHVEMSNDELRVGGVLVTREGGWLALETTDRRVPPVLRRIDVHLAVVDDGESAVAIVIDRIRYGDILWRDPNAFLEATDNVWAPVLETEIERAMRVETKSGVHRRRDP